MKFYQQFLHDLKKVISINSEKSTPLPNKPFGEGVFQSLQAFLDIAKDMGFETINYDNYMGEIVFGEGEELGIIGHVDVVPAGVGWKTEPYKLSLVDGKYYGRGVSDDKGPLLASLYALKELKESGVPVNRKFRLFVGCDEESGWQDVEYFLKSNKFPEYGFSPDGNFPVSYAEKGVVHVCFEQPELKNFYDLQGGVAVNAVCALATCRAKPEGINLELLKKHGLLLEEQNLIVSHGKSAHGALPHLGVNAFKNLFSYFAEMGESVQPVCDYVIEDKTGLHKLNNEQGNVTLSFNLVKKTTKGYSLVCDCRIPAPLSLEDIKPYLDSFDINYTAEEKHPPVMVEKDGWLVKSLCSAYSSITKQPAKPIYLNGSSFARVFERGVTFGAEFPDISNALHDAGENVSAKMLKMEYEIYVKAIFELAK